MRNTAKTSGKSDLISTLERARKTATWKTLEPLLSPPESESQYEYQKQVLQELMLETEDSTDNPYNGLMDTLAFFIESYEKQHYPIAKATPVDVLKSLMEDHGLKQSDIPEIGNQAKVSEILKGKRKLNVRQIKALSERFNLAPSVFID